MSEQGFSNKSICGLYDDLNAFDGDNCPYAEQFKNLPNVVMAPIEFAGTNLLKEYSPNEVAVDDCLYRM